MKWLGVLILLLVVHTSLAGAQESTDPHAARVANDVSHQILSPFCPGKTLAMCPSPAAAEVRMKIQDMAESGMESPEITEAVIAEYGEEFRTIEPPWTDDLGLFGVLGGGLALALAVVVFISRRRTVEGGEPEGLPSQRETETDDPYLEELRKQYRD